MTRFFPIFLLLVLFSGLTNTAAAADPPKVTIMQSGADELLADLDYIVGLAGKQGAEQWPVVEGIIQTFLGGIDTKKPLRIDVILDGDAQRFRPHFPIADFDTFNENLDAFGIGVKKLSKDYYQLKAAFQGFMRISNGYASIGEVKEDVPSDLPDPVTALKPFLDHKFDIAADIQNSADGQDDRRESFDNTRKELLATVKQKKEESKSDFDIRKLTIEQQLKEAERFFVESSQITFGWTTDVPKKQGRLDIDLAAIADSELEKSIKLLAEKASYFTHVKQHADSIFSGRINHPLDEMRKEHLSAMQKLVLLSLHSRIDESEDYNDGEKANYKKGFSLIFDMVQEGIEAALVDGFVEISQTDGEVTFVGGIKTVDGTAALDVIKMLPETVGKLKTELNIDKEGDVEIHTIAPTKEILELFEGLFPEDTPVYIGTSKEAVWYAAGTNGLTELKAAIKAISSEEEAKVSPTFIEFTAKMGPILELRSKLRGDEGDVELRNKAIAAFKDGNDTISFKLDRVEDKVAGGFQFGEGILRFVGKMIAQFSEEKLQ